MNLLELITGPVFKILDKIIPDPAAKAQAQLDVLKLQQAGEFKEIDAQLQIAQGQIDINKAEATTDLFRGGWRPAVGWVCTFALFCQYFAVPCMTWASNIWGIPSPPKLDLSDLLGLLMGMLGLGTLRTVDKIKGVG